MLPISGMAAEAEWNGHHGHLDLALWRFLKAQACGVKYDIFVTDFCVTVQQNAPEHSKTPEKTLTVCGYAHRAYNVHDRIIEL
jgi:hypothetical protein